MKNTLEDARKRDAQDDLRRFRELFYLPRDGIYMDGNSLGLASRLAEERLLKTLEEWKQLGIEGWRGADPPWIGLAETLSELIAPLLGATPESIILANSTTVNLHQALATFYRPASGRRLILIDEFAFPTDVYAIKSQMHLHGLDPAEHLKTVPAREGLIEEDDIIAMMDYYGDDMAMLLMPGVVFTSGQWLDFERLTREAHQRGIIVGMDAAHSAGSVPLELDEWAVDFAVWCNYKYFNAGPGAVGGLYVNQRHLDKSPGLAGWFGSDKTLQFDMAHNPVYAASAGKFQMGTPPIFSLTPLQASLEMFHEAGLDNLRQKSLQMTDYLMGLIDSELSPYGFSIGTPREENRRGGHVALVHEEAARINKTLRLRRVIPDFRPPDIIRLAPVALYTSFEDVAQVVLIIQDIMETEAYLEFENIRDQVA